MIDTRADRVEVEAVATVETDDVIDGRLVSSWRAGPRAGRPLDRREGAAGRRSWCWS